MTLSAVLPADERKIDQGRVVKVNAFVVPFSSSWRMWPFKAEKVNRGHDLEHGLDLHGAKRLVQVLSHLFHASRLPGRNYGNPSDSRSALET